MARANCKDAGAKSAGRARNEGNENVLKNTSVPRERVHASSSGRRRRPFVLIRHYSASPQSDRYGRRRVSNVEFYIIIIVKYSNIL